MKATTVSEWLRQQMASPRRRKDIDILLEEMCLEQSLIALRQAKGLTQRDLAKLTGVKQPMISRIESGQVKNIEIKTLLRLVTGMGGRVRIDITKGRQQ